MNTGNLRATFLLGIIAVIVVFTVTYVLVTPNRTSPPKSTVPADDVSTTGEFVPYSERGWLTYTDTNAGYRIDYPSDLRIIPFSEDLPKQQEHFLDQISGVTFSSPMEGPAIISVKIYRDTRASTLDEWLKFQNQKSLGRTDLEASISIDGHEAWVTYPVSVGPGFEEAFINEKKTAFFNDGILFEIWTRFGDDTVAHERIWKSFRFLK